MPYGNRVPLREKWVCEKREDDHEDNTLRDGWVGRRSAAQGPVAPAAADIELAVTRILGGSVRADVPEPPQRCSRNTCFPHGRYRDGRFSAVSQLRAAIRTGFSHSSGRPSARWPPRPPTTSENLHSTTPA